MLKDFKKSSLFRFIVYAFCFGFLFYIMSCCPKINDDFKFLSYNLYGVGEMWKFSLYYGNGRLLGNFLSLLLIRHPLLIALEKSAIIFLIIILMTKLFTFKHGELEMPVFLFSYVMIMGVSPYLLQEVFTWFTCFQNYVVPVAGMLMCVYLIRIEEKKTLTPLVLMLIFIIGFTSQLYLELNSGLNAVLAFALCILCLRSDRKKLPKAVSFAASSVFGGLAMFMIPKIFIDPERKTVMENYRGFQLDSFETLRRSVVDNTAVSLYKFETSFIPVLIIAVMIYTLSAQIENRKKRAFCRWGSIIFPLLNLVFQTLSEPESYCSRSVYSVSFMIFLVWFFVSQAICTTLMDDCFEKTAAQLSIILSVVALLPIMIVKPYGARCAYLFTFLLIGSGFSMAVYMIRNRLIDKRIIPIVTAAACILTVHIGMNYFNIAKIEQQRDAYIREQLAEGCERVEVFRLPSKYMHNSSYQMYGTYYYREKPCDTEFFYIDYDEWYEREHGITDKMQ